MAERIDLLHTEQRNMDTVNIADVSTLEMVEMINREDQKVALAVKAVLKDVAAAVELIAPRIRKGGRAVYMGAGTSARIGFMDAAECPPTYGVPAETFSAIMAGGREAVFAPKDNKEDDMELAVQDLKAFGLTELDTVIAAAASGRTPYCISALDYARSIGAGAVAISCNPGSAMAAHADVAIEPDTGAEAILGSTRMKAGTAQKMVMNMLSTAVMIRCGRTCSNLMVCLKANNVKIRNRVIRLFKEASGCEDEAHILDMLAAADNQLDVALLMEKSGCTAAEAKAELEKNNHFGEVLAALQAR